MWVAACGLQWMPHLWLEVILNIGKQTHTCQLKVVVAWKSAQRSFIKCPVYLLPVQEKHMKTNVNSASYRLNKNMHILYNAHLPNLRYCSNLTSTKFHIKTNYTLQFLLWSKWSRLTASIKRFLPLNLCCIPNKNGVNQRKDYATAAVNTKQTLWTLHLKSSQVQSVLFI